MHPMQFIWSGFILLATSLVLPVRNLPSLSQPSKSLAIPFAPALMAPKVIPRPSRIHTQKGSSVHVMIPLGMDRPAKIPLENSIVLDIFKPVIKNVKKSIKALRHLDLRNKILKGIGFIFQNGGTCKEIIIGNKTHHQSASVVYDSDGNLEADSLHFRPKDAFAKRVNIARLAMILYLVQNTTATVFSAALSASTQINHEIIAQPLPVSLPQSCNANWLANLSPVTYTLPAFELVIPPDPIFKFSESLHKSFIYNKLPLCTLVGKYDISHFSGLTNLNLDKFEIDKGSLDKGIFVIKARASIAPVELAADLSGEVRAECGIFETGKMRISGRLTLKQVIITLELTAKLGLVNGVYSTDFSLDNVIHEIRHIDFKIAGITSMVTDPLFGLIESIVKKDALVKLDAYVEQGLKRDLKNEFPKVFSLPKVAALVEAINPSK